MHPSRRQIRSEERCLLTGQTSHMANHASAATATMPATVNAGLYIVPTLLMAVALLSAVALAANYLPAHRAARLDPMSALCEE